MQRHHLRLFALPTLAVYLVASSGCSPFRKVEKQTHTPAQFRAATDDGGRELSSDSPYLKVHMHAGNVYVLSNWKVDGGGIVSGTGVLYGPDRKRIEAGAFSVGADSVALFETNVISDSGVGSILAVVGVLTVAIAIYCATHEKACFGSCPTFYVAGVDSLHPRAEGFSSSIAPCLEESDIDDIDFAATGGATLEIEMRNEAYETHVVRRVDMLAAPHVEGHRVFADAQRRFWSARELIAPVAARGLEGDCVELIARDDGRERFSEADSLDLRASEFIEVEFPRTAGGHAGIVIDCRQTLLTTYLLYQTLAYMGSEAGRWLAELERGNVSVSPGFVTDYLGCIDVQVADDTGQFVDAGSVCEYGPIAVDRHIIPLDDRFGNATRVRLVMTRGNWRVDRVALAALDGEVTPLVVRPTRVTRDGHDDAAALSALLDSTRVLTTLPGDHYTLHYELPGMGEYDLFLDAQGYYLEWIRKQWLKEENAGALTELFAAPDQAMKRLAPEFKRVEGRMEAQFWSSRYERR